MLVVTLLALGCVDKPAVEDTTEIVLLDDTFEISADDTAEPGDSGVDTDPGGPEDIDGDGYSEVEDCDDGDAEIHPGADEHCDGVDEDCDARIDEDAVDMTTFYPDDDEDGEGYWLNTVEACEQPDGYTSNDTDCDDGDASLNTADADADGVTSCDGDCDDGDGAVNPGEAETCDGADNDCDGVVDGFFCGGDYPLEDANARLIGELTLDLVGEAVSDAGDVNSDGFDDVLIGAPLVDDHDTSVGVTYLLYGGAR